MRKTITIIATALSALSLLATIIIKVRKGGRA